MLVTVDTLSFRVRYLEEKNLFEFLGLDFSEKWQDSGVFNINYYKSYAYRGIRLGYEGQKGYGYYVYMSGKGCRAFEDERGVGFDWLEFICEMHQSGVVEFTRIDIACDEFDGLLEHERLKKYIYSEKYSTRCTSKPLIESLRRECIYIGSEKSTVMLRIYNKMLERGKDFSDLEPGQIGWNRAEFQLRDDRATQFITEWIDSGDIGSTFFGFCNGFFRFLAKSNDKKNSQRIATAGFWKQFIGNASKIKFASAPGSDYNMYKVYNYVFRQAASSIDTYLQATMSSPGQFIEELRRRGVKLRSDQLALIDSNRRDIENAEMSVIYHVCSSCGEIFPSRSSYESECDICKHKFEVAQLELKKKEREFSWLND